MEHNLNEHWENLCNANENIEVVAKFMEWHDIPGDLTATDIGLIILEQTEDIKKILGSYKERSKLFTVEGDLKIRKISRTMQKPGRQDEPTHPASPNHESHLSED